MSGSAGRYTQNEWEEILLQVRESDVDRAVEILRSVPASEITRLSGERLVRVASFQWVSQADMARLRLEREGIPCVLTNAATAAWFAGTRGEVAVEVRECDRERAIEILYEEGEEETGREP